MSTVRVTNIRTFLVGGSRWGWLIVRVDTDAGVYGLGEGSLEGREQSVQAVVAELERYLVGQDPTRIEQHYEVLYRQAVWTGGAVLQSAISAVEMALWDIKGKLLGPQCTSCSVACQFQDTFPRAKSECVLRHQ